MLRKYRENTTKYNFFFYHLQLVNPFSTNAPLLYLRFSDVLRGYRSGTLVENGLIGFTHCFHFTSWWKILKENHSLRLFHANQISGIGNFVSNNFQSLKVETNLNKKLHFAVNLGTKRGDKDMYNSKDRITIKVTFICRSTLLLLLLLLCTAWRFFVCKTDFLFIRFF